MSAEEWAPKGLAEQCNTAPGILRSSDLQRVWMSLPSTSVDLRVRANGLSVCGGDPFATRFPVIGIAWCWGECRQASRWRGFRFVFQRDR